MGTCFLSSFVEIPAAVSEKKSKTAQVRLKKMISYVQLCPTKSLYTPTARKGQRCRVPFQFTEPNGGHSRDTSGGSGTGLLCRSVNDRSDLEATRSTTSMCNSQPPSLHTVEKSHAGVDRVKCRIFFFLFYHKYISLLSL